jgi:3-hydroxymyristoyl/3-hydroxydecanoyl-(acyl carrier protein) dehydratase
MPSLDLDVSVDHPGFDGHFPGRPMLPGVVLLAEVLDAMLGDPSLALDPDRPLGLRQVKFLSPVLPGARLRLEWSPAGAQVAFVVWRRDATGDIAAARGEFDRGEPGPSQETDLAR